MLSFMSPVLLQILRHWGVAARAFVAGPASTHLASAMAPATRKGLARPLASVSCTRAGRRGRAKVHPARPSGIPVEAFLVSTVLVGLAEIGDKTQILSLMLAARFLRPVPIIFGILFATLANHAAAGLAGTLFGSLLTGPWMRWVLGLSFLSVAVWALIPDKYEGDDRGFQSFRGIRDDPVCFLPR